MHNMAVKNEKGLTRFRISSWIPWFRSTRVDWLCPYCAVKCKGVKPFWKRDETNVSKRHNNKGILVMLRNKQDAHCHIGFASVKIGGRWHSYWTSAPAYPSVWCPVYHKSPVNPIKERAYHRWIKLYFTLAPSWKPNMEVGSLCGENNKM